jgi:hypothetical protein
LKNYDTNDGEKKDKWGRIRIRIWIGIKMESRAGIRIGIKMMWIHNTVFSYVLRPESTGSTGPDPAQPLITAIRYSIMESMPPKINSTAEMISHKESIPWCP